MATAPLIRGVHKNRWQAKYFLRLPIQFCSMINFESTGSQGQATIKSRVICHVGEPTLEHSFLLSLEALNLLFLNGLIDGRLTCICNVHYQSVRGPHD